MGTARSIVKRIGRGSFTTAFLMDNGEVLLRSRDPIKECMANNMFPNSRLFPKVRVASQEHVIRKTKNRSHYTMRYYEPCDLKQLNSKHYRLYWALRRCYRDTPMFKETPQTFCKKLFDTLKKRYPEFKYQYNIILQAYEACRNYSGDDDVMFEISPRNVRVHNGNLILLDCFYIKGY